MAARHIPLTAADSVPPVLELGSPAPDFNLPGVDGRNWALKDFAGSKLLVVLFTLLQGPTLPAVARRTGAALPVSAYDVGIDSAPLEELDAILLQFTVPPGSRLSGVEVAELRLPRGAALALLLRDGELFVPTERTVLRTGDHGLIATAAKHRRYIERRLREVNKGGRLAEWYAALTGSDRP